jgi:glycosyltransferase involved in cell wall biosynthesis
MPVKLSIVTPSFNQAAYLERTIRSVLAQRDLVHEYFVIDGGSTDASVEIIKAFAPGIDHWVSEPDRGQCDAIHRGFERATGDVLYWLNSDDVLLPGALERVHAAFESAPGIDVVSGYGVAIDAEDRILHVRRRPHDSPWWARMGYVRVTQPCCFFRRGLYEAVGGLDLDLHCVLDTDLWYRMFRNGTRWRGVDHYLAAYRLHAEAKGSTLTKRYQQERELMKTRYPEMVGRKLHHALGRVAYYATQLATGRTFASIGDMKRYRGKRLDEVFGRLQDSFPPRK